MLSTKATVETELMSLPATQLSSGICCKDWLTLREHLMIHNYCIELKPYSFHFILYYVSCHCHYHHLLW